LGTPIDKVLCWVTACSGHDRFIDAVQHHKEQTRREKPATPDYTTHSKGRQLSSQVRRRAELQGLYPPRRGRRSVKLERARTTSPRRRGKVSVVANHTNMPLDYKYILFLGVLVLPITRFQFGGRHFPCFHTTTCGRASSRLKIEGTREKTLHSDFPLRKVRYNDVWSMPFHWIFLQFYTLGQKGGATFAPCAHIVLFEHYRSMYGTVSVASKF
jgi:hypothetical protein